MRRLQKIARRIAVIRDIENLEGVEKLDTPNPQALRYVFETSDGKRVLVRVHDTEWTAPERTWEVEFTGLNGWSKHHYEVIEKVMKAVADAVQDKSPGYLAYRASGSRDKLYRALFQRFVPGREVVHAGEGVGYGLYYVMDMRENPSRPSPYPIGEYEDYEDDEDDIW